MIISDMHMHSTFSTDSQVPPETLIETAIRRGLKIISITDHMDCEWTEDPGSYIFDEKEYFPAMQELKKNYADRIDLRIGMEFGFRDEENVVEKIDKRWAELKDMPFDFIIGSTHLYDYGDPCFPKFWEGKRAAEVIRRYYEATLFNVSHYDDFDIYGHLDYVMRYIPDGVHIEVTRFLDITEAIIMELLKKGKGLEINTSRLNKGFSKPNPDPIILKMYRQLGGEIITVGSDAHKAEYVGGNFDKARDILLDCGFKYYTVFKEHKAEFKELL